MKIIYIKLINFIGVKAAMGLNEAELSFADVNKPIIQLYGPNRCGKTVMIHQLHPFSSINLDGDERSDLSLILRGEVGVKNIVYEINGELYNITHTYKPSSSGNNHTISSSIIHNGEELNPSGGVNVFNNIIDEIFGINKYVFQFIINGTQLTSFAKKGVTQRKNIMNKAMGIDIYDKIHKLATDDYRYTSKLITSLNNTKEFLLSTYGSYENLCSLLDTKREEYNTLSKYRETTKSRLDTLSGQISIIRQQNPERELIELADTLSAYKNVVEEIGEFDNNMYDRLVNEQIDLNNDISDLKNERLLILKDIDILYGKRNDIENTLRANKKAINDYNDMVEFVDDLKRKIDAVEIKEYVTSSSSYLLGMISLAQAINGTCKEIVTCLNDKHLKLFVDMIERGIDISGFLIREGSILMDSEKEKSTISKIRTMLNSIEGDYIDDCCHHRCIYKRTHETLDTYFKSYQSVTSSQFTEYDIEQFDHVYKNVQTIKRLINMDIADELKNMFNVTSIMHNISAGLIGIDVSHIQYLMEEAAKIELRNKYITQLSDAEKTLGSMKELLTTSSGSSDEVLSKLSDEITHLNNKVNNIDTLLNERTSALAVNDKRRLMLSRIQHVNIDAVQKRYTKLNELMITLNNSMNEYNNLNSEYNDLSSRITITNNELTALEKAYNQYVDTTKEIESNLANDQKYKVIAEATSSTKGKPVIAIREKVENALIMTNRLLDVMYDGEIELLTPTINETTFSLPFRCGGNTSIDIRYGSQSESTLLSLALSLSLSASLTQYNIPLIDEIDAYLDSAFRDSFILMLQEIMATLRMEQLFIISHNIKPNQYEHIVQTIDISKEINNKGED